MRSQPSRWLVPLAVISMLVPGCGDAGDGAADMKLAAATSTTATVAPTTTVPETSTKVVRPVSDIVAIVWGPILATTKAKPAPPAATCPDGPDPDALHLASGKGTAHVAGDETIGDHVASLGTGYSRVLE